MFFQYKVAPSISPSFTNPLSIGNLDISIFPEPTRCDLRERSDPQIPNSYFSISNRCLEAPTGLFAATKLISSPWPPSLRCKTFLGELYSERRKRIYLDKSCISKNDWPIDQRLPRAFLKPDDDFSAVQRTTWGPPGYKSVYDYSKCLLW